MQYCDNKYYIFYIELKYGNVEKVFLMRMLLNSSSAQELRQW